MTLRVFESRAEGTVTAPPSKSLAHRALICAALADGTSRLENIAFSEDISATADCLRLLGADIRADGSTVTVRGCAGHPRARGILPCRESGSTLRFLIPLCLLSGDGGTLCGSPRLMERPLSVYETLFPAHGLTLTRADGSVTVGGTLIPGTFSVPGNISSQFLSGLLFALPLLGEDSTLESTTPPESGSYLDLTLSSLARFGVTVSRIGSRLFRVPGAGGYRPANLRIEGDESNAAFFGALRFSGGTVRVDGCAPDTLQGDRVWRTLFAALERGFAEISVSDCPDLAPILMTVAAMSHGARLTGTHRLKIKESDRGAVMAQELRKFGAEITLCEDSITVHPVPLHAPEEPLDGHNDHRVVMSLAVLCTRTGGVIRGAEAVRKSMPDFFDRLEQLKVRISPDETTE